MSQKDNRTYTGSTDNLSGRLGEHNRGFCKSTKNRRPFKLVYAEEFDIITDARKREKYLKTTSGRREIKKILNRE